MTLKEQIIASKLFDKSFYLDTYPDVLLSDITTLDHFLSIGLTENRQPNAMFDTQWYKNHYNDIAEHSMSAVEHFVKYGEAENRFINPKEQSAYRIIDESGLFNETYYISTYTDLTSHKTAGRSLLLHFIRYGIYENRKPNQDFDPQWYKNEYSDVSADGANPLVHYILFGQAEGRKTNGLQQMANASQGLVDTVMDKDASIKNLILTSGLFDEEFYLRTNPDVGITDMSAIEHYYAIGMKEDRNPNNSFDAKWYKQHHADVNANGASPLIHYILFGQTEGRQINSGNIVSNTLQLYVKYSSDPVINTICESVTYDDLDNNEKNTYTKIVEKNIDWSQYFSLNTHSYVSSDPIIDYLKNWSQFTPLVPLCFDTNYYLTSYPDIKSSGLNPLLHYLNHGKNEGRVGLFDEKKFLKKGNLEFNPSKKTIIFVSHESSATGAPLLGYNIADRLATHYNIIHMILRKKEIHNVFLNSCFLLIDGLEKVSNTTYVYILKKLSESYDISCVVLNSIETYSTLQASFEVMLPTVSLIHEFSEYTRPIGKMTNTLKFASEVITPANIIKMSLLDELEKLTGITNEVNHISQFPQGKLPFLPDSYGDDDTSEKLLKTFGIKTKSDTKIIVGSGYVQIRKGIDLFLYIARYIKQKYKGDCKFVWVGDGFNPEVDMAYSVWLKREIKYLGLENDMFFLEHQKSLDNIFKIADIFCLTSRMDPFPNVVIDAMEHNLPIACFKEASGSVEFLEQHNGECIIANFLDTHEMAEKIVEYFQSNKPKNNTNAELVKNKLDFDEYIDSINNLINRASKLQHSHLKSIEFIQNNKIFDTGYYGLSQDERLSIMYYVSLYHKGLHKMNPNPLPGFSQGKWLMEHKANPYFTPLESAIASGNPYTHDCRIVPVEQIGEKIDFIYAVHLHLFYIDLADVFVHYFKNLPGTYDLLITVVKTGVEEIVKDAFAECSARDIKVVFVDNIGRDSGPLYFGLKDTILNSDYEVIGHFHSKKSFDIEGGIGDRWRTFLMENLVGDADGAQSVLSIFNDQKIGLVFPDDNHVIDIGENKEYMDGLCTMLNLPEINETPIFPIGNMFWARVNAIKDLFYLDKNAILQPEPLPYDGSYMHAIERITPALIEGRGYTYATVYKKGTKW